MMLGCMIFAGPFFILLGIILILALVTWHVPRKGLVTFSIKSQIKKV
jgi:hypothetical protein